MHRPAGEIDWEAVYREQLPRIYNYFRYRLWDEQLAEDLTSTTFEHAWRARARYDQDKGCITTWLFAIARHIAIDHLRQLHPQVSDVDEDDPPPDGDPSLEDQVQHQYDLARLARLVRHLSDDEKEMISLKYGANLTNCEIAWLTCRSETNVGVILFRAIQRIREMWEKAL